MLNRKGFTLIELLVVVAIIGLLSSLAVVSLNSARNKAYDAQVKSDLTQFRTFAALEHETGDYTGLAITGDGGMTPEITPPACSDDATYNIVLNAGSDAWAAWGDLCSETGDFCVDSEGNAKVATSDPTALSPVCP